MRVVVIGIVGFQTFAAFIAAMMNCFLIYIIKTYTKNNLGFYKYVLIIFACFEIFYAVCVTVIMPVHYITEGMWIGMNYMGPLAGTPLAKYGPTVYCMLYEMWMGFVMFNFIYRFVAVCKTKWLNIIGLSCSWKVTVALSLLTYLSTCVLCAQYLCPANEISKEALNAVFEHLGIDNTTNVAYYAAGMKKLDGTLSWRCIIALGVHYFYVYGTLAIIGFCSYKIYKTIKMSFKMIKSSDRHGINLNLERQLFMSLVIQATIPICLCIIPSFYVLLYPILPDNIIFQTFIPFFSVANTLPKTLDPMITLFCIAEYRHAVIKILGIKWGGRVEHSEVLSSVVSRTV